MQAVYMTACMDQTSLLPKVRVITTASTWDYTLPTATSIINGETYVFYYGTKAINLKPGYYPLLMTRTLISGPGANDEIISEINVITATSGTNGSKFLLVDTGIWDQNLLQRFETVFSNTRDFRAETNLLGLGFTGPSLLTAITNYPTTQQVSVTGSVNVSGISDIVTNTGSIDTKLPANLTVASNKLQVIDASAGASLTSIDGKLATQVGQLGSTGLLNYCIMPVSKAYTINGSSTTGGTAILGYDIALSYGATNNVKFGLAGGHSWFAKTTIVNRTLTYEYVDTSGLVGTNSVSLTAGTYSGALALQGGGSGANKIVSINKWSVSPTMVSASGPETFLSIDTASDANAIGGGNYLDINTGVFTCPPNARAFVSFVRLSCGGASDAIALIHYDVTGLRTARHVFRHVPIASSVYFNSGSQWGSIGGFIEAGESILFGGNSAAAGITSRHVSATIQVFYY